MTGDVVDLGGVTSKKALVPNQSVIAVCRDLLARAESGQLQQLAFVYVDATGRPIDGYAPTSLPEDLIPVIAGLELCKAQLLSQMVTP